MDSRKFMAYDVRARKEARRARLREDVEFLVLPIVVLVLMFAMASLVAR